MRSARWSSVGGIGGILFWGAFNWAIELSNTETFCIDCHKGIVHKPVHQPLAKEKGGEDQGGFTIQ